MATHDSPALHAQEVMREGILTQGDPACEHFFLDGGGHCQWSSESERREAFPADSTRLRRGLAAALDHRLVDPDEDMVAEKFPEMVSVEPPSRVLNDSGEEELGQLGALAAWAETTPGFDRSEVTERSIREGRIAYRGVIPPGALRELTIPSPSILGFVTDLPRDLRSLSSTDAPRFGGWRAEVERAKAIVRSIVLAVLRVVGEQVEIRVSDPADVPATAHTLIRLAADLARRGELDAAEAVAEARSVVEMLDDLMGFPLSDLDRAQDAARAAGRLTTVLETLRVDVAGRLSTVEDALAAAEAIPPIASETRR